MIIQTGRRRKRNQQKIDHEKKALESIFNTDVFWVIFDSDKRLPKFVGETLFSSRLVNYLVWLISSEMLFSAAKAAKLVRSKLVTIRTQNWTLL